MGAGTTLLLNTIFCTDLEATAFLSGMLCDPAFSTGRALDGGCSEHTMTFTGHSRRWSFNLATCTLKMGRRAIRTTRPPLGQHHCSGLGALPLGGDLLARHEDRPTLQSGRSRKMDPCCGAGGGGEGIQ